MKEGDLVHSEVRRGGRNGSVHYSLLEIGSETFSIEISSFNSGKAYEQQRIVISREGIEILQGMLNRLIAKTPTEVPNPAVKEWERER